MSGGLRTLTGQTDERGLAGKAVVNENVRAVVCVALNQVARQRDKRDVTSVGADICSPTVAIALFTAAGNAYTSNVSGLKVLDKNVKPPL